MILFAPFPPFYLGVAVLSSTSWWGSIKVYSSATFWLSCRMLQGKTNSEVLRSIQTQLNKFSYPQTARKAQRKVNFTKKLCTRFFRKRTFLIVFRICLIKQLISVSDTFHGFCFCRSCFYSIEQTVILNLILERVAPYFPLVPSQSS